MDLDVSAHGPLFRHGEAKREVAAYLGDAEAELAREGARMVRSRLHEVIRHPTGYYESRVEAQVGPDRNYVDDSGVVYGPWLEGVSSRNQTTRFRGYATFRRVRQELEDQADRVVADETARLIRRLDG